MYTARDVMNEKVISVPAESTVEEAVGVLLKHGISGAPVVDPEGSLVGIVSEFQFLELVYDPKLRSAPVSRFMTRDVLTVTEETKLGEVVRIMVVQRVRRVLVVRDGRVVGLISRPDLIRYVLNAGEEIAEYVQAAGATVG